MQKALQQMNLKLTRVLSDIAGVTGLHHPCHRGQRARPPQTGGLSRSALREERRRDCGGLDRPLQAEHVFALRQALAGYDFFGGQIQTCDAEIAKTYQTVTPAAQRTAPALGPRVRRHLPQRHEPAFDLRDELYHLAGVDLTTVNGLDVFTIQSVLTRPGWTQPAGRRLSTSPPGSASAPKPEDRRQDHQAGHEAQRQPGRHRLACGGAQPAPQRQRPGGLLSPDAY